MEPAGSGRQAQAAEAEIELLQPKIPKLEASGIDSSEGPTLRRLPLQGSVLQKAAKSGRQSGPGGI